jgi:hypothetical protein
VPLPERFFQQRTNLLGGTFLWDQVGRLGNLRHSPSENRFGLGQRIRAALIRDADIVSEDNAQSEARASGLRCRPRLPVQSLRQRVPCSHRRWRSE